MTSPHAEFTDHAQFLRALARRLAVDDEAADDLVQDTFTAALVRRPRDADGLLPWLATALQRIGSNRRRSDARRRDRERHREGPRTGVDASIAASEIELARRLLEHVESLAEPYRTVVFLRYYEDLPPREIAARTGTPVATVRTRLARALDQLRSRLDADDPRGREAWLSSALALGGAGAARGSWAAGVAAAAGLGVVAVAIAITAIARIGAPAGSGTTAPGAPNEVADVGVIAGRAPEDVTAAAARRTPIPLRSDGRTVRGLVEDAVIGGEPGTGRPAAGVDVEFEVSGVALPRSPHADHEVPDREGHAETGHLVVAGASPSSRWTTTTRGDGSFELDVPDGAVVERVVAAAGDSMRSAEWRRDRATSEWTNGTPLRLTRFPTGALLGRVVDPAGNPVGGARVTLGHWEGRTKVQVETFSDANGRFTLTETHDNSWLRAEHEDWTLLGATRPSKGPRGGWIEAEIVMARTGTLELELVDASGRAASDVPVHVGVHAGELGTDWSRFDIGARPMQRLVVPSGRASIRVPTGVGLALFTGATGFTREREGVAIPQARAEGMGHPIVVPAAGSLALRAELGVDAALRGTVVDPSGARVTDAEIELRSISDAQGSFYERLSTDERGCFATRVVCGEDRFELHVIASAPGARPGARTSRLVATRQLVAQGTSPIDVRIELEPLHERSISGRVQDDEGRPVAAEIHVETVEADDGEITRPSSGTFRRTDADGTFECSTLPRGRYRVRVRSRAFADRVIEDVHPGGPPLAVTLAERRSARLRIDAGAGVSDLEVIVARLEPRAGKRVAPTTPASIELTRARSPFIWSTFGNGVRDEGRVRIEKIRAEVTNGRATIAVSEGPMWIGVTGRDARFQALSRVSSELVTIDEGTTLDVKVTLASTVTASGRVVQAGAPTASCIAFVDDEGRFLHTTATSDGRLVDRSIFATGTHGDFALREVPLGPWEIWVGTRDELERGEPRHRERVVARAGERLSATIEM